MKPEVSIIVPVYNAADYLQRCVDSILHQEYQNFELILVNDGSTDRSGEICDCYAKQDNRVRVIHKENSGVSAARNQAISLARGTYLQFLDSDDWITPDSTKLLVRAATTSQSDLVIADFYRVVGERLSQKGDIDEEGVMTREEYAAHMMGNPADYYYGVLWNKLYKKDIIENYHIRMDETIHWCEDFMFNLEYIFRARRFYALPAPIYYYVKRKGSLVNQNFRISQTIQMKLSVFEYYNQFYKNIYDEKDYEKNRLQVYRFLIDSAGDGIVAPPIMPKVKKLGQERQNIHSEFLSKEGILMDHYRNRKLLEHYLEVISIKYDLSLKGILLLFYVKELPGNMTKKELADLMDVSQTSLTFSLQKLVLKNLIRITEPETDLEKNSEKQFRIELLPDSEKILSDLDTVKKDFEQVCFFGFTKEEQAEYERLTRKKKDNIVNLLNPPVSVSFQEQ